MEFRAARAAERDEVLDLLALWFNDRDFFARYNQHDPGFRDDLCLVALDGGKITSTVQIFDRTINLKGLAVPMGGIGSVFTRDDYRHKSVASGLMELSLKVMASENFELSLLFAERLTFYNQFGWKEFPRTFTIVHRSDPAASRDAQRFIIEPFNRTRDLAAVMQLYRACSGRFDLTAVRDEAYWRGNLQFAGNTEQKGCREYFIIARDQSGIRAYARAIRRAGACFVMECGYDDAGALSELIDHICRVANGLAAPVENGDGALLAPKDGPAARPLVMQSAHDPALEVRLEQAGLALKHHIDNHYMWRIIAPQALGVRFKMAPEAAAAMALDSVRNSNSVFWESDRF